jgi:hypothetical protein
MSALDPAFARIDPRVIEAAVTSQAWQQTLRTRRTIGELITGGVSLPKPRLLVPIDVRGLVVREGVNDQEPRADVRSRALDEDGDELLPPPFSDTDPLPPGVHLHWAMPDGLTAGHVSDEGPRDLELPPLPDRWIVARLAPITGRTVRRAVAAWVIDAERGEARPLTGWRPRTPGRSVTAVSGGDPAWAAVYDDVRDRFAFHDPLEGIEAKGTATYCVMGWYAREEDDPLDPDRGSFEDRLEELRWTVSLAGEKAAEEITDPGDDGGHEDEVVVANARRLRGWGRPTRSLYHGTLYDVRLDAPKTALDTRPRPRSVTIACGTSLSEALARRLSGGNREQERLLTALEIGVLDRLQEPDGPAEVDQALHQHAFGTRVDDTVTIDHVRDNPIATRQPRDPARPAPRRGQTGSDGSLAERLFRESQGTSASVEFGRVHLRFATGEKARFARTRDDTRDDTRNGGRVVRDHRRPTIPTGFEPGEVRAFRRPGPRWFHPTDPSLVLGGVQRSQRHGGDGRFDADGYLHCRLTGQPVTAYEGVVSGADAVDRLVHTEVPIECDPLVQEAALTDPTAADQLARAAVAAIGHRAASITFDPGPVTARIAAELTLHQLTVGRIGDVAHLRDNSLANGQPPSPVAAVPWQQPWVPLYLEWRLDARLGDRSNGWRLGELDLEPDPDRPRPQPTPRTVSGRSLLTPAATSTLAHAVQEAIEAERRTAGRGRGRLTEPQRRELTELAAQAEAADLLAGALDGLHEHLLGFDTDVAYGDDPDGGPATITPDRLPQLLRTGELELTRLRVVDAYGQFVDLDDRLKVLERSEPLEPAGTPPATVVLTPRITTDARIHFRLLDAADDAREAEVDDRTPLTEGNPVAGWLLPDNADDALEVFDTAGRPLGQLRAAGDAVAWEGTPGDDSSFGDGPVTGGVGGEHLARFVAAMLQRDARERDAGRDDESPLSALLRTIDTTRWTCDPFGSSGLEHVSELIGRPIAVVRASVELQLRDPVDINDPAAVRARAEAFAGFADRALPLRLGSLSRFDDGLLGVFVDDDYRRLRPTHALIKAEARSRGPGRGHLGSATQVATMNGEAHDPITSSYIADVAELSVHPGHRRMLTLLMLPGLGVHATAGLLPRKRLELVRSWTATPLARISPSFRVGPVLLEPGAVRLPRVSALPEAQEFSHRDTPTSWRHDPIQGATATARLPDRPATIHEGWIRARQD